MALLLVLGLSACDGFKAPKWEAEILGPLATADLAPEDIIEVQQLKFAFTFNAAEIQVGGQPLFPPGVSVPVPAFGPINVGFFDTVPTPQFRNVYMSRLVFRLSVRNGFPMPVSAGTTILVRNEGESRNIVSYSLPQDLAPGATYTALVEADDKRIGEALEIQLQNLSSPGTGNTPVSGSGTSLRVEFTLHDFAIDRLEVNANQFFEVRDTSDFTLSGDVISSQSIEGNLIFRYNSGYPVSFSTQVYFLDGNRLLLDSLFVPGRQLSPAITDGQGNVITPSTARDTIAYTAERMEAIREAKYTAVRASVSSFGAQSFVVVTPRQRLDIKIIGDLKVNVNDAIGQN